MSRLGGRKFVMGLVGIVAVVVIVALKGDPASYGAVTVIYGAFCGANGYVEGKHAPGK